ncbi:MAG: carboxypeptidase-like regulatory domain-containing protein [Bacteroidales bacterium]
MKKIILFLFLINFYSFTYSQIIKGTILDKSNNSKISFASIYLNGTYVGTYSDQNGYFDLDITKYNSMPLTISALGYYSITLPDFSKDRPLVVYLTPKIFELNEVVVKSKSLSRERKEKLILFRNEFLGPTENGQNCEIINEKDISFNYDSDKDTLKAFASKPLLIYNRRLGYKITYYLDKFEYYKNTKSFFYQGSIIFNEDSISEKTQIQSIDRRRRYAYLGSRMHFFRELWTNNLSKSGFKILNSSDEDLDYKNLIIQKDSLRKFLSYHEKIGIGYYSRTPSSYIIFHKNEVFFDKNGYFDSSGVAWEGQMAKLRIGDLLPYEYNNNIK